MTAALVARIARETARLGNQRAWQEIPDRLHAAGIPERKAWALREAVWRVRGCDSEDTQKCQAGAEASS